MTAPRPHITRQLLRAAAVTNVVAAIGIVAIMWATEGMGATPRIAAVSALLALVGIVWASTLRRQSAELIEAPLAASVVAAERIAAGDTTQRLPAADTAEFDALAASVNRMTERLLEADALRLRVEKLATLGRLAAGIAHEVGNPLAAVTTYAHVVRMRAPDAPEFTEPLDAMDREVARIDRIVRGLLDYARPRLLTPKPVIVDTVIAGVLQLVADQGVTRRVSVETEFAAPSGLVYAERHDLEQLFVNLVLNAVDAMEGSGVLAIRTRVTSVSVVSATGNRRGDAPTDPMRHEPNGRALAWLARSDRPEAVLQVIIADSGPGVRPDDAERVFEPFFSTKAAGQGTGLGLAIVARIAENLGGTVWVQRARAGGAAFVLLFPLHGGSESYTAQ